MSEELYTVETAAARLQLHAKTVLRFIREGRLRASKVGKQYRILRSDLEAFAGAPIRSATPVRVTSIVEVPDVGQDLLQRLTAILIGARETDTGASEPMSVDIAHDPVRRTAKVIMIGSPGSVATMLKLVDACVDG